MTESDQLALDASIAPARILAGYPQREGPDRRCGGWSAWRSVQIGPAAGDELGVPAQQGSRRHEPQLAQWVGSSLLSALSTARSSQVSVGRALVRRSTATSCRSVRISTSLAASERASSTSQLSTRTIIR
jgi:hypothetical protein